MFQPTDERKLESATGEAGKVHERPSLRNVQHIVWCSTRRNRNGFALVVALMVVDAVMGSLGIGLVLPVLQTILQGEGGESTLHSWLPVLSEFGQREQILLLSGATVLVFGLRSLAHLAYVYHSRSFSERMRVSWIRGIAQTYLLGRVSGVLEQKHGELLNNWQLETATSARFIHSYLNVLAALLQVAALLAIGLYVDWQVMLAILLLGVLGYLSIRAGVFGYASELGKRKLRLSQAMTAHMAEDLSNIREVKLLRAEERRVDSLTAIAHNLTRTFVRLEVHGELPRIAAEFIAAAALMFMIVFLLVILRQSGSEVLPTMAFFLLVIYRLITASSRLVGGHVKALTDFHSIALVQSLATDRSGRENVDRGCPIEGLGGPIDFDGVSYAYRDDRKALRDVSLRISPGQLVFVVGPSGSGKSTLLDLLLRILEPTKGDILVNGRSATEYSLASWRQLFAYVSQDTALFNGTLRSNLLLARPEASEDSMRRACDLAGVTDFMGQLPEGLDTPVGDRGVTLSGGQRKRMAIARALLSEPAVLVLDEATTSFEEKLERRMLADLRERLPGLTIIQVTHRLQTVDRADSIIFIEDGRARQAQDEEVLAASSPIAT